MGFSLTQPATGKRLLMGRVRLRPETPGLFEVGRRINVETAQSTRVKGAYGLLRDDDGADRLQQALHTSAPGQELIESTQASFRVHGMERVQPVIYQRRYRIVVFEQHDHIPKQRWVQEGHVARHHYSRVVDHGAQPCLQSSQRTLATNAIEDRPRFHIWPSRALPGPAGNDDVISDFSQARDHDLEQDLPVELKERLVHPQALALSPRQDYSAHGLHGSAPARLLRGFHTEPFDEEARHGVRVLEAELRDINVERLVGNNRQQVVQPGRKAGPLGLP